MHTWIAVVAYLAIGGFGVVVTDAAMLDGELDRWKAWTIFLAWPLLIVLLVLTEAFVITRAVGRRLF
jgi:hypothetical protein